MLNINLGGTKNWQRVPRTDRRKWIVVDVDKPKKTPNAPFVRYDLNSEEPLPFISNTVDNVYCSHTLEHIKPHLVMPVLKELRRIMKPDAVIRMIVPDIALAVRKYVEMDIDWLKGKGAPRAYREDYPPTLLGYLEAWFYSNPSRGTIKEKNGHCTVFDLETLIWYMEKAGFRDIENLSYGVGKDIFLGLEFEKHKDVSIYLEACK